MSTKPTKEKVKGYQKNFYSPSLALFAGIIEAEKNLKERHKQMLFNIVNQSHRTPFEQAAYDLQHTHKNRVSGPQLGDRDPLEETKIEKHDLVIFWCVVVLFVIMLILV